MGPVNFFPAKILDKVNLGISQAKTTPTPTIRRLLVIPFIKYRTSHGPWLLREGPETSTEWKSESLSDGQVARGNILCD